MRRGALKALLVAVPFLMILLGLRACSAGEGRRWLARIREVDPEARLLVDDGTTILIAPSEAWADHAGGEAARFRDALISRHGDLVGEGKEQRLVIVVFSTVERLQAHFGARRPERDARFVHGYTRSDQGAIFLPPDADFDTLRHECVHLVVGQGLQGGPAYSPWVGEGLALLFERGLDDPGLAPGELAGHPMAADVDVTRLLAIEEYVEFTGPQVFRNYLDANVLMSFLFRERPRALLQRYLEGERTRSTGRAELFRRLYRNGEEPFDSDLRAFVARLRQPG